MGFSADGAPAPPVQAPSCRPGAWRSDMVERLRSAPFLSGALAGISGSSCYGRWCLRSLSSLASVCSLCFSFPFPSSVLALLDHFSIVRDPSLCPFLSILYYSLSTLPHSNVKYHVVFTLLLWFISLNFVFSRYIYFHANIPCLYSL